MNKTSEKVKKLIIKYLTNSISEEEMATLKDWLQDSDNQEVFKSMVRNNQELDYALRSIDVEKSYERILKEISRNNGRPIGSTRTWLKYAAIAVVLIGTSFGLYTFLNQGESLLENTEAITDTQIVLELEDGSIQILDENEKTSITNKKGEKVVNQEYNRLKYAKAGADGDKLVYDQLTVPYGRRFEVELADGTTVFLNAGTKLRYPRAFTDPNSREVYLDGEAYFNVHEDSYHPFIVHTEKMNVRVLGTKFNVSSYQNENNTSTVLVEGSVGVYEPGESFDVESGIVISPSQQAMIQDKGIMVREVNIQKYIAWINGELYFVNDRFENIIKELERHYNIRIQNNYRELNNTRYTGTFFESETIEQILNTFKKNSEFEYKMEDGVITIQPSL